MLNQFSFGHLQSTDRQNCAASENHYVMRETDSIKNDQQEHYANDSSNLPDQEALNIESQIGLSQSYG